MAPNPYPMLRLKLTPVPTLKMRFLPAITPDQTVIDNITDAIANLLAIIDTLATVNVEFVIDGGGLPITTGVKGDLEISFGGTITAATLLADVAGNMVVDVWTDAYGNYPPTVADSITAATPPTLTAALKSQDMNLTGWNTTLAAGNTLRFNVTSTSNVIGRVTLSLQVTKDLT